MVEGAWNKKRLDLKTLTLTIPLPSNNEVFLQAQLTIPLSGVQALIIFAHGSGSGRESPRNQYVAKALNGFGFATLLVDLLTPEEQESDISCLPFTRSLGMKSIC